MKRRHDTSSRIMIVVSLMIATCRPLLSFRGMSQHRSRLLEASCWRRYFSIHSHERSLRAYNKTRRRIYGVKSFHESPSSTAFRESCNERIHDDDDDSLKPLFQDIEHCWNATAWTVTPPEKKMWVDGILQKLCSPAPQSYFVIHRAVRNVLMDNNMAIQSLKDVLESLSYLLKPGYNFVIDTNARNDEAMEVWNVVPSSDLAPLLSDGFIVVSNKASESVLDISQEALVLAVEASNSGDNSVLTDKTQESFALRAKQRLMITLGTDIRGRTSADASFNFALSGIQDPDLYQILTCVCQMELCRVASRPSFKSKFMLQMVEKLAASGVTVRDSSSSTCDNVYSIAASCLEDRNETFHSNNVVDSLKSGFDLHSPRSLLWLWRFSSRQQKVTTTTTSRVKKQTSRSSVPWIMNFPDANRPLVVDVGCGLGVSLLGLSTLARQEISKDSELMGIDWTECNFVGCDLSALSIGYARGIAHRWGLHHRVQFVYQSAQEFLNDVHANYPGRASLVMIQFPSPFRLKTDSGNSQLALDALDGKFMVTPALFQRAAQLVEQSHGGRILVQSNCEDVAVAMKDMALQSGSLECVEVAHPVTAASRENTRMPLRTEEWLRQGGGAERAIGPLWSRDALLPSRASTETEVACQLQDTPIHRCLFKPQRQNDFWNE